MAYRKILRWFYQWRAWRLQKKQSYAIDRRHYNGQLGPGFLAFLEKSRFYGTAFEHKRGLPLFTAIVFRIGLLFMVILLVWIVWESIRALSL